MKLTDKPHTLNDDLRTAQEARSELNREICQVTTAISQAAQAEWDRTGCPKCKGRGWVVTWDTLDCMQGSYAEYGKCPNPECNASETGPRPGCLDKYDRNRGTRDTLRELPAYKAVVEPLKARESVLASQVRELEDKCRVRKGSKVVAVKGRKVKPGTVGVVAFVHDNGGVLIKAESEWERRDADGQWTNPDNLEVIEHLPVRYTGSAKRRARRGIRHHNGFHPIG